MRNYSKEHGGKIDTAPLLRLLDDHPDWYLDEFANEFGVWPQSIQKRFAKLGVSRKKTFTYSEKSKEAWGEYLKKLQNTPLKDRIYVDECGINDDLRREYGWARIGVKVEDTKRRKTFHCVNVVAAMVHGIKVTKRFAPMCYQGR